MKRSLRRIQILCLVLMLAAVALGVATLPRLTFNNDILALFPGQDARSAQSIADQHRAQKVEREILLLVHTTKVEQLQQPLEKAQAQLVQCQCFSKVAIKAIDMADEPFRLASEHPALLLTPASRTQLNQLSAEQLSQSAWRRLMTRPGGFSSRELATDPLGTLAAFKANWQPTGDKLHINDAGFAQVDVDGKSYLLVRLTLAASPFSLQVQQAAIQALDSALAEVRTLPGADILTTGALFYTHAGTEQAKREISTVGLGSLLGIVCLFLWVFRSPSLLVLAFVPIGVGVLAGLSVVQWWFGHVHVIALVFGSALVGVAIDYTLHFYAKRFDAAAHWQLSDGYRRLLAPLSLGLLTSVAGYLSFSATGFPGFTQVAVMSSAGLIAAFVTVMGLFPLLLARPNATGSSPTLLALLYAIQGMQRAIFVGLYRPLGGLALGIVALTIWPLWQSNDDIRQMQSPPAELKQMEETFRDSLGARQALQYLLVQAPDAATLLARLEQTDQALAALRDAQQLTDYDTLNRWLPSPGQQRKNLELWQQRVIDSGALEQLLTRLGVGESGRATIVDSLTTAPIIAPGQLLNSAGANAAVPLLFSHAGSVYSVVNLYSPFSSEALIQLASTRPHVSWVDPVGRTNQLLEHYRHNASGLLLLAYALIWLLLCWRYGAFGALAVVTPPAAASVVTLALLLVMGHAISVFHIMALMLVLGIGIDYTLFIRESAGLVRSTLLAIGLSTVTTVLSFGLLALSGTLAIAQFGMAVFVGIVLAFFLAPLAQRP
ncbi:MMPL family transporter [Gilvimarinus sp. SDUM040013]|uniref:MMPL family transporter n=1 Tax=Gilvimarinus gilvus TaxID=3058038 RepID=A0ABU4S1K6_9GAMM|nr:MMPL family transporter [Gilvimarinus sp. SDUM040013]MDO3387788.1 MMPL family transporter [Gilvimarinus sp. SDUM040013]MDX6851069.1 MMPL family transporter [Gilvimarinus sp. SDUM040013]